MKKNLTIDGCLFYSVKKALLIMKLTLIMLMACIFQASAKVNGQTKVSLNLSSTEIGKALKVIENQGVFRFLYNNNLSGIHHKVSINASDEEIIEVLNKMFTGTDLIYKILDNNLIVVLSSSLKIQDIKVTGKVTDENGLPLSGVSISVKGSKPGTTSDNDGNFTLTAPEKGTLVFSYIGYQTMEVQINSQAVISISLVASKRTMDAVVVIGYGVASKRDLTGSIVKIDGKVVADKPNSNPINSLQSKVSGLYVVNNGTPGAQPDVRIRGTVSIGQVHPLYVVDGVFNDNIDFLNPNDIESIEILKDPSSLAIFGVRGATGVIAITTKKAKAGATVINFNTFYGWQKLQDKIKWADASQFSTLFAEENANNGVATPDYSAINSNTDWIDAVTRTANISTTNLSVSSSTDKNKFYLGLGYTYQEGLIKNEQLRRFSLSFTDELKLSKAVKIGINFNASRVDPPYDATWVLDAARKVMPQVSAGTKTFRVLDPYGTDSITAKLYSTVDPALQSGGVENPLIQLQNEWNKTINNQYRTVGNVFAEFNFLKHFTFRATFYGDLMNQNKRQYVPLYYAYNPLDNSIVAVNQTTKVIENNYQTKKFQQDYILTYMLSLGDHHLTAMAGYTTFYTGVFNTQGIGVPSGPAAPQIPDNERFWYVSNGFNAPSLTLATSDQNEYTNVSFLGRVLYNYKNKYYLNASYRDDASSRLLPVNQHQQFWAVGGAWEVSKEKFMQNQKMFDFLKVHGSTGVLGNQSSSYLDGTPINYPAYPLLSTGNSGAAFGNYIYNAAVSSYDANPNLKWETVSSQELGVEFNMFDNRLHFEYNYFNKTTENLMIFIDRSAVALKNILENGGSLRNWGNEFTASWNQNLSKDFTLNVGGNITFLQNKVLSLSPDIPNGVLDVTSTNNGQAISETKAGEPIGYFKGMVVSGIFQSYSDIISSPSQAGLGTSLPGDFKYKDVGGPSNSPKPDGVVDYSDRTFIGNPSPKFYYGANINLTYKGLSLGIDVGGVYGNMIYRTWGSLESPFQRVNYAAFQMARWHGPGTSNWVPIISQGHRINFIGSTYSIEDGSYFRLRNIQLGYSFSNSFLKSAHLTAMRVFLNVQNLKTWKNNSGYSPEFGGSAVQFGYDNGGGAIPSITTLGINLTF